MLHLEMSRRESFFSPKRFPSLTVDRPSINERVSSTSCSSAVLRKFTVWVRKSRSRFPSADFSSKTSVTSMEYSLLCISYFQPCLPAILEIPSAISKSVMLSFASSPCHSFCFEMTQVSRSSPSTIQAKAPWSPISFSKQ